jgi:hypothetical protein
MIRTELQFQIRTSLPITLVRIAKNIKVTCAATPHLAQMTCRKVVALGACFLSLAAFMAKSMTCTQAPAAYLEESTLEGELRMIFATPPIWSRNAAVKGILDWIEASELQAENLQSVAYSRALQ